MCLFVSVSVCVSVRLCVCLSLPVFVCLRVCVSVRPCAQILKPAEKKTKVQYSGIQAARPGTPPRNPVAPKKK